MRTVLEISTDSSREEDFTRDERNHWKDLYPKIQSIELQDGIIRIVLNKKKIPIDTVELRKSINEEIPLSQAELLDLYPTLIDQE